MQADAMVAPLMAGELHELSVAIGKLQQGQKNLVEGLRDIREASTIEHRKVHDIVVSTSEAVRNLAAKVATMEPLTKDYELERAEKRGMNNLVHVLYVGFGGVAGAVAGQLMAMFGGKPPHP